MRSERVVVVSDGVTRAAIVDDHSMFREGLALALGTQAGLEIVAQTGDSEQAIQIARTCPLDLVLLDVLLPDTSGISLTAELREIQPACKIIGLSVIDEPLLIADMLRAGANGYASKAQSIDELVDAIRRVLAGERYLPPRVTSAAIDQALGQAPWRPVEQLTRREREVFELLIRGHTNDDIATKLFIARRTVETHRQRIMNKLSARSVVEMIRVAARHGALDP